MVKWGISFQKFVENVMLHHLKRILTSKHHVRRKLSYLSMVIREVRYGTYTFSLNFCKSEYLLLLFIRLPIAIFFCKQYFKRHVPKVSCCSTNSIISQQIFTIIALVLQRAIIFFNCCYMAPNTLCFFS